MRCARFCCALTAAIALLAAAVSPAAAQHPEIDKRRAAQRTVFSDRQIARGFFKVAFGAELGLAGRVDRIRRYEKPVRIYLEGAARPNRRAALTRIVNDIRARIANLDIAITQERREANIIVHLVRDRDLTRTVTELYGAAGRRIVRALDPQCLSGIRKDNRYRIVGSDVILVVDAGTFLFYDCAYEELLQALGPIRDDPSIPWTMFNDDVQMGFFDIYDQYILNILYHPLMRAGMTRKQVRALLPRIMPDVRAFVAAANAATPRRKGAVRR